MNSGTLPPAASWYLSSILAYNDDGLLAYGSRNEIILFRLNERQEYKYDYSVITFAHSDRLNCLAFSPHFGSFKNCLASCGDDGLVRIWDVTTLELKFNHSGQEGTKIMGLDWSIADPNLVVCTNDVGTIDCWDLPSNTIRRVNTGLKIFPLCLSCCRHDKDIIAIGAKTGFIAVINIKGNGKTLFRVKGHEGDVVSLSWCPVPDNILSPCSNKNEKDNTLLLASGGTDRCVFIWRAGVDMRYVTRLFLPNQSMGLTYRKSILPAENKNSNFICVRWVDPYQILSSSGFGELLSWDLRKVLSNEIEEKKKGASKVVQPRLLHAVHNKGLFSIACRISCERNIESKGDKRIVWTTAVDRHLVSCNIFNGQTKFDLLCVGNIIYCLAVSPVDPNNLAIGTGDGKILIWDMSSKVLFKDVCVYWKKVNGKVMALAWHPLEENILAFGTVDGRVGLFTIGSDKNPVIFKMYHRRAVYTLAWAPPLISSATTKWTELALFSVGDGEVVQFCMETPDRDPVSLESTLKAVDVAAGMKHTHRTDIAFKFDFSVFAVANENGSVHILSCTDQERLYTLYPHKKSINALVWHPSTTTCGANSRYQNWLASGAENIKVFSIPVDEDSPVETIASLNMHLEKIASLVWNPHYDAQLMSASYDYSVQIWDVLTQTPIASYMKHNSAVLCSIWSPLDPDFAMSGSYDNTLQVWKISEQTSTAPVKKKQLSSNLNKQRSAVPSATFLTVPVPADCLEDYTKRLRARSFFPISSVVLQNPKHLDVLFERVVQPETETPCVSEENQEMTLESAAYLDYFGDQKAMKRLLMMEDSHLREKGHFFHFQNHALWRGDVSEMLEEAIKKKQLSDWLVSMAATGSYSMWTEMCSAYAKQLTDCGEYVKAASYLLALHKVEDAILLLMEHKLYKEALAIAKSRYPEDDPTITLVLNKWGKYSSSNGQLMLAAHCYLATGDYLAASDVLIRCNDLKSLKLAALMADKAGAAERAETLLQECLLLGLQHANYKVVEEIIERKTEYLEWSLWLEGCQIVSSMKRNKKNCEEHQLSWLKKECTAESMLDRMKPVCEKVGKDYSKLSKCVTKLKMPTNDKELWYIISGHVALLCATYHDTGKPNLTTLQHWVSALACAYHFQMMQDVGSPLLQICYFFSPQGPFSSSSLFMSPCETEEEKLLMKSARAFLCAGIVHWLANSSSVKETILNKNGDDKNEKTEILEEEQLDWLVEILDKCQADVLDPESFCFFKTKVQKQLLLDILAKDKAEKIKITNKTTAKIEGKKKSKGKKSVENKGGEIENEEHDNEDVNNVELEEDTVTDNGLDRSDVSKNKASLIIKEENEEVSKLGKGKQRQPTSKRVGENGSGDEIPIKLELQSINTAATEANSLNGGVLVKENDSNDTAKCSEPSVVENGDGDTISNCEIICYKHNESSPEPKEHIKGDNSKVSKNCVDSKPNTYKELEKLDSFLNKFQECRISAPNPFVASSNIKCAINYYVKHFNPDLAQEMDDKCDNLWKLCAKNNLS